MDAAASCLSRWTGWVVRVMDAASFSGSTTAFSEFHACLASFGRSSGGITAGIIFKRCWCRTGERRNAENLSEIGSGHLGPRRCSAFSPRLRWSDEVSHRAVAGIPGNPGWRHPEGGVGVRWQRLPQAGQEIGGSGPAVLRQAGQGGQLPGVGCSWPTSARWAGRWWTSGCICPRVGPRTRTGVLRRVCRRTGRNYRSKTELALEMLERALELGYLKAGVGRRETTPSGCRRPSGRDWRPWGCATCWTFRPALRSGRLDPAWTSPEYPGFGRPRKPKLRAWAAADHGATR